MATRKSIESKRVGLGGSKLVRSREDLIAVARERQPNPPTAGDLSALDHALSDFYCDLAVASHAIGAAEDTGDTELLSHAACSLRQLVVRMESLRTVGDHLATRAGHAEIHGAGGAK